jgi:hypothetical protein
MQHIISIDKPQLLTDEDINVLYNACDVGINTCDGEGFGLCNFEQAGVGVPQIVPRLGGFIDIFDDDCTLFVEPVTSYYVDSSRDGVGGEASMCHYKDFVAALERYYSDPGLRELHGKNARHKILDTFLWETVVEKYEGTVDACLQLPSKFQQLPSSVEVEKPEQFDIVDIKEVPQPQDKFIESNVGSVPGDAVKHKRRKDHRKQDKAANNHHDKAKTKTKTKEEIEAKRQRLLRKLKKLQHVTDAA